MAFESLIESFNPTLLPSFLKAAAGLKGIQHPRTLAQPAGSGKHFEWFKAN